MSDTRMEFDELIKEYLKNNLTLETERGYGLYDDSNWTTVKLCIGDEVISKVDIDD